MACGLALLASGQTLAAPYCFQYTDTLTTGGTLPATLAIGDAAKIIVKLDNGGSSLNSQTWTGANLQSVTFDFKNGTLKTTFTSPWGGALSTAAATFVTNSSGVLTSVMTSIANSWGDDMGTIGTDFTTNDSDMSSTKGNWYLNGNNNVYGGNTNNIFLTNVTNMTTASNWSNVSCSSSSSGAVSAPIDFNFNKPVETFATEIELK